jgi:hypothetical protein
MGTEAAAYGVALDYRVVLRRQDRVSNSHSVLSSSRGTHQYSRFSEYRIDDDPDAGATPPAHLDGSLLGDYVSGGVV